MKIVFTAFARGFNRGKRRFRFAFYKDNYFFNAGGSSRSLALPQDDEVERELRGRFIKDNYLSYEGDSTQMLVHLL